MNFKIRLTDTAKRQQSELEFDPDKRDLVKLKKVRKCLGHLQSNPKHPRLGTHEYTSMLFENREKVWEAYEENRTSAAWRVFLVLRPSKRRNYDCCCYSSPLELVVYMVLGTRNAFQRRSLFVFAAVWRCSFQPLCSKAGS